MPLPLIKTSKPTKKEQFLYSYSAIISEFIPDIQPFDINEKIIDQLKSGWVLAYLIDYISPNSINFNTLIPHSNILENHQIFHNLDVVLEASKKVLNITEWPTIEDFVKGNESTISNYLSFIVEELLICRKNIVNLSGIYNLLLPQENITNFRNYNNIIIIDRWVKYHLNEAFSLENIDHYKCMSDLSKIAELATINHVMQYRAKQYNDFTKDFSNCYNFAILIFQLIGDTKMYKIFNRIFDEPSREERTRKLMVLIESLNLDKFVTFDSIYYGQGVENYFFLAYLFFKYPSMDKKHQLNLSDTEISKIYEKIKFTTSQIIDRMNVKIGIFKLSIDEYIIRTLKLVNKFKDRSESVNNSANINKLENYIITLNQLNKEIENLKIKLQTISDHQMDLLKRATTVNRGRYNRCTKAIMCQDSNEE